MQRHFHAPHPKAYSVEKSEDKFDFETNFGAFRRPVFPTSLAHSSIKDVAKNVLLLDLDNTLTDTRRWFADFILDATAELASDLKTSSRVVNSHFADVAIATTLHEYAFVVEAISCRISAHRHLSYKKISCISEQFWQRFSSAHQKIELYKGVRETLSRIRAHYKGLRIIILTDSPEWVALQRLHITGILPLIDGLVAIRTEEPKLRQRGYRDCIRTTRHRIESTQSKINKNHLMLNLSIPAAFAKPSSSGIELIAKRLGVTAGQMIICGDKDTKEGQAAERCRRRQLSAGNPENAIHFVRADYGNHDLNHSRYTDLAKEIRSLSSSASKLSEPVPVADSIEKFEDLFETVTNIMFANNHKHALV